MLAKLTTEKFYFCSSHCKIEFDKAPQKFAGK
ncbi:YHS domain-containing protein [Candidatus Bathyarchaeota archaeon]|nr:MAG: YHS domain-containing protein [Candidatus Bathyarchaeota archaeon]TMI55632.1 MAG: YHS domain-containing protein [Candidatus Bathyarchaeota archaeon]